MAVERAKVLAKLEAKFKGKSLTKNFKDKIAEKWAAKIDTDDDIDAYIDDREDVILEASTEADRRATQAHAKGRQEAADAAAGKPDPKKQDDPAPTPAPDDAPAWAKALIEQNKKLTETVTGLQQARQAESLTDRFKNDPRLKGVPDFLKKRAIPQKEEDFETSVTELAAEYTQFATDNKLAALGSDAPAGATAGSAGTGPGKVDSDIVSFAKQKNEAVTKQNS